MGEKDGSTRKETDFWGNEKEVHYDGEGNKIGETKFTTDFWGSPKQEHYNTDGNKIGETKRGSDFWGSPRAEHFDSQGKAIGRSRDDKDFFGQSIQRHYDSSGKEVGVSRREKDFWGDSVKVHKGEYFKARGPSNDSELPGERGDYASAAGYSDYGSSGGYSGTSSTWTGRTSTQEGMPAWLKWTVGLISCVLLLNLLAKHVQYPTGKANVKKELPKHIIPAFKYITSRVTEDAKMGAVALIKVTDRGVILFTWKTIGDPKRLLLSRITRDSTINRHYSTGSVLVNWYYSTDSVIEVPFTDFAFLLVYVGDYKFDSDQIKVFAEKGSFWRSDSGSYPEFFPEDNPANVFPVTIAPLDLDEKQVFLISPIGGDFPQDSQIVLQLTYPRGYYVERFFTNSTIRQVREHLK